MKLHANTMTGDGGVALIHLRCNQMGFAWTPRTLDAGIDGLIEIRDDITGEVKNCVIHVQSKAVKEHFSGESAKSVEFVCQEKHISYWLGGNAPVIIVLSRPDTDEAYWKDVKAWFKDPARRASRKVVFDREKDVFDTSAKQALIDLAEPEDTGLYFAPEPREETLTSNMVPVSFGRPFVYTAETWIDSDDRFDRAVGADAEEVCWTQSDGQVISFEDLREPHFRDAVEVGTVERHDLDEWALGSDRERQRLFVQLLNRTLRAQLAKHEIDFCFEKRAKYFFFTASDGLAPRVWEYRMVKEETKRTVFERYVGAKGRTRWCRHSAFKGQFVVIDGEWFLEIVPTYRFTSDGVHVHQQAPELLKKIKLLEKNKALLGQVHMWADVLARNDGLFDSGDRILQFGQLLEFRLGVGIPEEAWLEVDESADNEDLGGLFE
jgi:hypothetical protein